MESPASTTTAPISTPPPTAAASPFPAPQSNGAAPAPAVDDPPTSGDDVDEGFETASDPDDAADPLKSAAAVDGWVGNPSLEEAAAAAGGEGSVPAGSVEENRAVDVGGEEDGVMRAAVVEEPVVKVSDAVDEAAGEEPVVEVPVAVAAAAADGGEEIGAVPGATEERSAARDEVGKIGTVEESSGAVEAADGAEKIEAVSDEEISEESVGVEKIGAVSDDAVEEVSVSAPTDAVGAVSHTSSEAAEKNGAVSDRVEEGSEAIGIVVDSDVPSEENTVADGGKVEENGVPGAGETEAAGEKDETAEAFASAEISEGEVEAEVVVTGSDENIEEVNSDHGNLVEIVAGGEKDEMLAGGELGQDPVAYADAPEKIDAVSDPVDEGFEAVGVAAEVDQNAVLVGPEETSDLKEEPVTGDVVNNESSGTNKDSELAAESKPVDIEGVTERDVKGAASGENLVEGAKSHTSAEDTDPADSGEAGNDGGAGFDRGVEEVENSVTTEDTADELDLVTVEATGKNTGLSGATGTTDFEEAKESTENHVVVDEGALMKQETADLESVELIPVGESSTITADESHSREAQPISVSEREVEPEVAEPISVSEREVEPELAEPISVSEREVEPEVAEPISVSEREVEPELAEPISVLEREVEPDVMGADTAATLTDAAADDDEKMGMSEVDEGDDGTISEGHARVAILESSETAKQLIKEMEEGSTSSSYRSGFRSSEEISHQLDGQIVTDSEEEVDTDEEGDGRELFDSAALTALLKAATGASADGGITITPQDATRIFSVNRPAGLGSSVPSLKPAPSRSARPSPLTPSDAAVVAVPENNISEEDQRLQEKVEQIRVKFLRLVQRLGHSPEDTVAAQVLYRLGLAEGIRHGRQISRLFSVENAKKKALQLEDEGKEDLDFSCNILVLGKTGVGKSATINSIFGEGKSTTSSFKPATTSVREISGIVDGVRINILDTPGFRTSVMDQAANRKILQAVKKHTKRCPPDIVLYVDRMDTQTRDLNDLPLLRSITSILGSSIWFNAIVALTHAASAPPDGPNGSPLSYEVLIAQRSHVVQQSIRQAAGDMRLMNPVALVENHPSCRRNREGERVLPNGLSWRPQLLLLCYSSKILSEANSLLKLQDPSPGKLFGFRIRSPPLPYLLSSLLQSKTHPKLSADLGGDNGDSDIDLDDVSDTEQEEDEEDYNQLPPFKPLRKSQIAKLTKEQKRAYFDEYDYRVKLLQKTQWKEELKRMKEMRKKGKSQQDDAAYGDMPEDFDQDGVPASVPVPLPDMILPPSFDSDNPVYRYRLLEPTSEFRTRPASESQLDHDCGYDGVSIEESLAIAGKFPAGLAIQITKDKTDFNLHVDSSVSAKHGENGSTLAGFDIQQIGKQLAYVVRGETKFKNLKKNKTAAGVSVTFLGETVATGMKIEDQLSIGKRVGLVATTGAIRAQGDMAYGANLEVRLRDNDYPIGQALTTLGLSLMRWRSDLALGANLQSQFSIGRSSKMAVRVGLNNKLTGQVTVRTSTSEQLQIALVGFLPLIVAFYRKNFPGEREELPLKVMHAYVDSFDFHGMEFDEAIRAFLQGFRLPGEAQKIDRIMEKFSERYCKCNPKAFSSADTAYVLAYSVILLNTDAHNPMVKNKMSPDDFLRNNRGIDDGKDIPEDFMRSLYERISRNEIKMKEDEIVPQHIQPSNFNKVLGLDNILNIVIRKRGDKLMETSDDLIRHMQEQFKEKARKSESVYYAATDVVILRFMVEVCWAPMLAAFSVPLDQSDDDVVLAQCLQGFRYAIHVTAVMSMKTHRDAFVTSLAKFTSLHSAADIKQKNIDAIKAIICIADEDGNYLQEAWEHVLTCVSRYEHLHLLGEGAPPDATFFAIQQNEIDKSKQQAKSSILPVLMKKGPGRIQQSSGSARRGSYDSAGVGGHATGVVTSEQMNNLISNLLEQIGTSEMNRVFVRSQKLNSEAVIDFVKALCKVSMEELRSTSNPRVFSLTKIVEIAHYNMNRIRLVWSSIWHVLSDFFVTIGCSDNLSIAIFAMDSLRQLAMKFLEREELANYNFQNEFMKPFVIVMRKSRAVEIRELIIRCVSQMVLSRVNNVKSGWKSMFMVFTTASYDEHKNIVLLAFEITEKIVRDYFPYITETETTTFTDCVNCLIAFTNSRFNKDISLNAIGFLRFCAAKLAEGDLGSSTSSKDKDNSGSNITSSPRVPKDGKVDGPQFTDNDDHLHLWFPLLAGLSELTFDLRPEIRKSAVQVLFDTLRNYGHLFSLPLWEKVFDSVLFPIFDYVRHGIDHSVESRGPENSSDELDQDSWLYETCTHALQLVVDLFVNFYDTLNPLLRKVLMLLTSFIKRPHQSLAGIGIAAFVRLMSNAGSLFIEDKWLEVVLSLKEAAAATIPDFSVISSETHLEYLSRDRSSNEESRRSTDDESDGLRERTLYFALADAKSRAAVQLLLIQAVMEIYNMFRAQLSAKNMIILFQALHGVASHAHKINSDSELRSKLQELGSMTQMQDPPLLRLENESYQTCLTLLQNIILDRPHRNGDVEAEAYLVDLCREILQVYLDTSKPVHHIFLPLGFQSRPRWLIPIGSAKRRELAARAPLVVATLQAICALGSPSFKDSLVHFFPLLASLISCEHGSNEVQVALSDMLNSTVGPVLLQSC